MSACSTRYKIHAMLQTLVFWRYRCSQTSRAQLVTATDSADFNQLFSDTRTILSDGSSPIFVCLIQITAAYFAYIFGPLCCWCHEDMSVLLNYRYYLAFSVVSLLTTGGLLVANHEPCFVFRRFGYIYIKDALKWLFFMLKTGHPTFSSLFLLTIHFSTTCLYLLIHFLILPFANLLKE